MKELGSCILAGGQYDQAAARLGKKAEAIGFALYLNEVNRIVKEKEEYEIDALVLYRCGEPIVSVAKAVRGLQEEGLSVRAEKARPKNVRARDIYVLENGTLRKEEPTC